MLFDLCMWGGFDSLIGFGVVPYLSGGRVGCRAGEEWATFLRLLGSEQARLLKGHYSETGQKFWGLISLKGT